MACFVVLRMFRGFRGIPLEVSGAGRLYKKVEPEGGEDVSRCKGHLVKDEETLKPRDVFNGGERGSYMAS